MSLILAGLLATVTVLLTHLWFPETLPNLLGFLAARVLPRRPRRRRGPYDNGPALSRNEIRKLQDIELQLEREGDPIEWAQLSRKLGRARRGQR